MLIEAFVAASQAASPSPPPLIEINAALMQSTFRLQGPSKTPGEIAVGSGLVIGRPCGDKPGRAAYTLVTAAHVLEQISGTELLMLLRLAQGDGSWRTVRHFVKIQGTAGPVWYKHPDADVASMYVSLPDGAVPQFLPFEMFATDDTLKEFEVHPGDEVFALGFPHAVAANDYGFPVLRSGRIASYPLLPQAKVKTFMVDMDAFPGNSGGPVYFWDRNRFYKNATHIGEIRFLVGIVTGTVFAQHPPGTRLRIAQVVHANFVREAVLGLSPPSCRD